MSADTLFKPYRPNVTVQLDNAFRPRPIFVSPATLGGPGYPDIDASRSHSDTPHSAELLWTTGHPDAQTST